jgi:hypothetical protein
MNILDFWPKGSLWQNRQRLQTYGNELLIGLSF